MAASHTRLRELLPRAGDAAALFAVRNLISFCVYSSGFRALSDDDYARITIAQSFASAPLLDPSHSSWLPAPFWLYGAVFSVFGTELSVARITALALSTAATWLVYSATRTLGSDRAGALIAATLSALLPYSAILGVAAVPEVPCAALIVFGAATLSRSDANLRALGGLSLSGACLCRYEAWPVALVFAGFCLWDARAYRRPELILAGAVAVLGALMWLLLGRAEHGQALFFVARVASYRRALGDATPNLLSWRLLDFPGLVLRAEPELCGLWLVVCGLGFRFLGAQARGSYLRPALSILALLGFLVLGSARDGVPTHHAARVLLPIWYLMCAACGQGLKGLAAQIPSARRVALLALCLGAPLIGQILRSTLLAPEAYAQRQAELSVGDEARRQHLHALAIDTVDYGYFAVQAAFGSPLQSSVLEDHDPRHPRANDPFVSSEALSRALREHGAEFLIATRDHSARARGVCVELWSNPKFVLFRCAGDPSSLGSPKI